MAAFFQYARNITYYLLFMSVALTAAPGGKSQKYLRLVLGVMLVALILRPLQNLLNNYGAPVTELFAGLQNPAPPAGDAYASQGYEYIKEAFEEQLERQLDSLLAFNGYQLNAAEFEYAEDFSRITAVRAHVTPGAPGKKPFIRIEPIRVGESGEDDETTAAVKKIIADFYTVSPEHIYVVLQPVSN